MLEKSVERFEPAVVGDTVMVPVPVVDRGWCEFRNVKAIVVECQSNALYRLGKKQGLLNQAYSRNQFTPVKEKFLQISDVPLEKELSLREVAHGDSVGNGQGFVKCGCKTGCISGRCKCKCNNLVCNSRCHNSLSCQNK